MCDSRLVLHLSLCSPPTLALTAQAISTFWMTVMIWDRETKTGEGGRCSDIWFLPGNGNLSAPSCILKSEVSPLTLLSQAGVHWPNLAPFLSSVTTTEVFRQPMALSKGRIPLWSTCSITAPFSTRYSTCSSEKRKGLRSSAWQEPCHCLSLPFGSHSRCLATRDPRMETKLTHEKRSYSP
jgi:hypothetical protein